MLAQGGFGVKRGLKGMAVADQVVLHGYRYSVYTWIARMVLVEKGVDCARVEVDPFAGAVALHPFGRVPVLVHGGFSIYETAAIGRYVDLGFDGPELTPKGARAQARMAQVVGIADSYAYWPMVRQVFAQRVFRPLTGEAVDAAQIAAGLRASVRVLAALEALAVEGEGLAGGLTLADCHLAPMLGYFAMAPEGQAALAQYPALRARWEWVAQRPGYKATLPPLPGAG